jgi:hypothetical protein
MKKLTAADANEYKMIIPWKVWNWAGQEARDLFYGYIGQETKEGVLFPHVPTYLVNQFNQLCYAKLQAQRAKRIEAQTEGTE